MSFFLDQDRLRSRMRLTVLLYVAAVAALTLLLCALIVVIVVNAEAGIHAPLILPDRYWIGSHMILVIATAAFIVLGVLGAAMYRTSRLSEGGAVVARTLGGSLVSPDVGDPQRRTLRHVVEEIAIAAGIGVPEVYVMECEPGINALSAGYTHSDAVVVVSRGCIDYLNREELQGIVAHEFVHILNGDARRNMRLTGALFGIMMISLAGRHILRLARSVGATHRSRGPLALLGAVLFVIGSPGYLLARAIQSRVANLRELRVDAAAVQFTRAPRALGDVLRKIAAVDAGSRLVETDATEYAHMMFAQPRAPGWPRTHPDLRERIELLDPPFDAARVDRLGKELARGETSSSESGENVSDEVATGRAMVPSTAAVARPSRNQVDYAAVVRRAIPTKLNEAAHSMGKAVDAVLALLIDHREAIADRQLTIVAENLGDRHAKGVRALLPAARAMDPLHRLPLVELAFPALRRRPRRDLAQYLRVIEALVHADGRVTVFEFALSRLVGRYLVEAVAPSGSTGGLALRAARREIEQILALLARVGSEDPSAQRQAFRSGLVALFPRGPFEYRDPGERWVETASLALDRLDRLRPRAKERVVQAMINVLVDDDAITREEVEILRAVCAALHCPMPPRIEVEAAG